MFGEAVELEGDARREYLDDACAGDPDLRRNVEILLAHDLPDRTSPLDGPVGIGRGNLAGAFGEAPERIGRYVIREKIDEGGMGVIYLAEQDHPKRQVALKVIRPGLVSEQHLVRFRFEAELLGKLKHAGIAQIYEAGEAETPAGRLPYFAMEYVEGEEVRRFAERRALGTAARLELLARICDAVQHAHQRGIVHRDLKPGNILVVEQGTSGSERTPATPGLAGVDPLGQPKVLDFGVSRLVEDQPAGGSRLTQTGLVVGTLAYMSPEQARGDRTVDTRSDVYSLGVIGFELLSGRLPHDCTDLPIVEAVRTVQEERPPRLDTVNRDLRGDPSVIVGKALEPDREHRYGTAAALAEDIRRYLTNQPIAARPPTFTYQLTRFVRRHKAVVAGSVVALLSLVAGLVLALLAQREEARQRTLADARAEEARRAAYEAQIQAVTMYAAARDYHSARRRLEATSADLRGWEWDYYSASIEGELARYPMALARGPRPSISPDGGRALLVTEERGLRLLDLKTFTWTDRDPGELEVGATVLLADGHTALVGDEHGVIHEVDFEGEGPPRPVLTMAGSSPVRMRLSTDHRHVTVISMVSSGSSIYDIRVLDLETMSVTGRIQGLPGVYEAALSPDAKSLAVGVLGGAIRVLETATGRLLHELNGHQHWAYSIRFSPDGRRLASAGGDFRIRIWSVESGVEERVLGPFQYLAYTLEFGSDGTRLVSGHEDGAIREWDAESGARVWLTRGSTPNDPKSDPLIGLAFPTGDGPVVGISPTGLTVRTSPSLHPDVLHHAEGRFPFAYHATFSRDGRTLLSAGWDGKVRVWDVATRRAVAALDCPVNTFWVELSPDGGNYLVSSQRGYAAHVVSLWDATTHRLERELDVEASEPCGLFLPARDAILLGTWHGLWILDPRTLEVREKRRREAGVWALALSPDGKLVACGEGDGLCRLLDSKTLEPVRRIDAHDRRIEAVAFSPDGKRLASGGEDATVRIFDVATGDERLSIHTPESLDVFSIRFTHDGRRIFVGSRHPSVLVYDAENGQELTQLRGHSSYVHGLALSPDGRILASASGDNTVRIWDSRPLPEQARAREEQLAAEAAAEKLVDRLFREHKTREAVLTAIAGDPALGPLERHAAHNVALRRGR